MMKTVTTELLKVIPSQCQLGEGVLWHIEQQAIYWIDIEAKHLYRYFVANDIMEKFTLPQRIGSFAFTPIDDQIVAAFEQGVARYNIKTSSLEWLSQPELNITGNRFNDGKTDQQGRFWAGTMVEKLTTPEQKASLYCIDHQLNCHIKVNKLSISNGLCWNKAGDILFHTDSPSHSIFKYDFCQTTGSISNKQLFATTHYSAFPDGSTVDADDHLWNAQWGNSQVIRYDTNGDIALSILLPVSQPSCVTLGGPNLDWLIVTTAKQGLSKRQLLTQPLAGNVFIFQLNGVVALAEPKCTI
ncbi:SMP-30/gluconolactonase/LRE family protein [Pseudocolwellia sp. AS88]|uniref:SMP-30/gluconolactonase/LRE family protein n=1 Tax=Pseudocolwellia sp. AS88 TaxID=3063958 RepID=UPI0026EF9692|nr:SMP-30/gluconolactonase/LRE family protein [Pseudocolwellia sp. AS88]MDO7084797.1 SMP-30/gluconolactonase/LRE family protein [Pseudocolwellia sp. AS88]